MDASATVSDACRPSRTPRLFVSLTKIGAAESGRATGNAVCRAVFYAAPPIGQPQHAAHRTLRRKSRTSDVRHGNATHATSLPNQISRSASKVVVFQGRLLSHLCYTLRANQQKQTRVKLNRVFFPRCLCEVRSLRCGFAGV